MVVTMVEMRAAVAMAAAMAVVVHAAIEVAPAATAARTSLPQRWLPQLRLLMPMAAPVSCRL